MNQPQTWLGQSYLVHTHQAEQQAGRPSHRVIAAAWCDAPDAFDDAIRLHLNTLGLTFLYSRDVQPAQQGLDSFTDSKDKTEARRLAEKIGPDQTTAISYLYAVDAEASTEEQSYLKIETLEGIEPLDGQFGVYPRKTVPDPLYEPLFGQPEPTEEEIEHYGGKENVPPMKLYAILDAAKVKVPGLRTMLRTSGLDFACLFTGQDYEMLKDSAPYIVELEEDNNFTRILFTHDPKMPDELLNAHLWHKELGIYIRSRANLRELGQHFMQFVRVQDEEGKHYIFRFWEETWILDFFGESKKEEKHRFYTNINCIIFPLRNIALVVKTSKIFLPSHCGEIVIPDFLSILEARKSGLKFRMKKTLNEGYENTEEMIDYFISRGIKSEHLLNQYVMFCIEHQILPPLLPEADIVFSQDGVSPERTYTDFISFMNTGKTLKRVKLDFETL